MAVRFSASLLLDQERPEGGPDVRPVDYQKSFKLVHRHLIFMPSLAIFNNSSFISSAETALAFVFSAIQTR